jgi:hypothetical protein
MMLDDLQPLPPRTLTSTTLCNVPLQKVKGLTSASVFVNN